MADLVLKATALNTQSNQNSLDIVESIEQATLPANVDVDAGVPVQIDSTTGKWIKADASGASTAKNMYITTKQVKAGMPVTGIRKGIVSGIDLSALGYGADVFVSNTEGALADGAGTATAKVGYVIPIFSQRRGSSPLKALAVDCP